MNRFRDADMKVICIQRNNLLYTVIFHTYSNHIQMIACDMNDTYDPDQYEVNIYNQTLLSTNEKCKIPLTVENLFDFFDNCDTFLPQGVEIIFPNTPKYDPIFLHINISYINSNDQDNRTIILYKVQKKEGEKFNRIVKDLVDKFKSMDKSLTEKSRIINTLELEFASLKQNINYFNEDIEHQNKYFGEYFTQLKNNYVMLEENYNQLKENHNQLRENHKRLEVNHKRLKKEFNQIKKDKI